MNQRNGTLRNNAATNTNCDDEFRLHRLNDHCLLKIFTYLSPRETENLAKTSERLKNLSLYPMHKLIFKFHSDMVTQKTDQNVTELDTVLNEYGEHIKSWSLTIENKGRNFDSAVEVLRRVRPYCTNLKKLEVLYDCDFTAFVTACGDNAAACFENVEYLVCEWCQDEINADFLRLFRKLKHVHFNVSGTAVNNLQMLFHNNPDIESFHVNGGDGFGGGYHCDRTFCQQFSLCEFGQKFDKLCVGATCEVTEMGVMQRLATTNLTKFKLDVVCAVDLHIFFAEMAKTGNLKELELCSFEFDRTWFDVLKSFHNLELLVVRPNMLPNRPNISSVMWPPNLKYLSTNIGLTDTEFLSTIRQLMRLQRLKLSQNSENNLHPLSLGRLLEDIFNTEERRPILQLTCGMSQLVSSSKF